MSKDVLLSIIKSKLGISSESRDARLLALIDSVISEMDKVHGLKADLSRPDIADFISDWVVWKYSNHDGGAMPRHLIFRLHNLYVSEVRHET